ncbi:MAG: protein-export chaperone SecB [Gammaproteobacteria bacterium]|nr:protein-export chaperone SecB [Gammaproteobacteria bacterium]
MTDPVAQTAVVFQIEKVYVKDSSFEVPNAPHVFLQPASPEIGVQLTVGHSPLDPAQGLYESVLSVTVTAKSGDKNVFLAEAHQAGLFRVQGLPESELPKVLEIACPNMLLPYVRHEINRLIESGGFPQLLISPINFEALYLQKQQASAPAPAGAAH